MDINRQLIQFLEDEEQMIQEQEKQDQLLPLEQKIGRGMMVEDCSLIDKDGDTIFLGCQENNSKFKVGDTLQIVREDLQKQKCILLENTNKEIVLSCKKPEFFEFGKKYCCEGLSFNQHKLLIKLLEKITPGMPGYGFLTLLDPSNKEACPCLVREALAIEQEKIADYLQGMTKNTQDIIQKSLLAPQVFAIQGPPGTGKSHTLAKIADIYYREGKTVLVLANAHQAVNNALSRIKKENPESRVIKIGQPLKTENLALDIPVIKDYSAYQKKHKTQNIIVGMTLATALVQLGVRRFGLYPHVMLIDEASQITLPAASVLGIYRAPSMIFLGDDKQLPPIFVKEDGPFSLSIFEHLKKRFPQACMTLNKTYRLNGPICEMVNNYFYKDSASATLFTSFYPDKRWSLPHRSVADNSVINHVLNSSESLCYVNISSEKSTEQNPEEARFVSALIEAFYKAGGSVDAVCVGTPYRKQVKEIVSCLVNRKIAELPVIDTPERLQGIDREMVILSMCSSDPEYSKQQANFIFNKNRLNVMLSRAKTKIVLCSSRNLLTASPFFDSLVKRFKAFDCNRQNAI